RRTSIGTTTEGRKRVTRRAGAAAAVCGLLAVAGMTGCATEYKKTEENLNKPPINCFTAEGDIRVLQSEKANTLQQMAAGLQTIVPTSIVVGLITGTSKTSAQVESGEYNRMIDARIAEIKSVCGLPQAARLVAAGGPLGATSS